MSRQTLQISLIGLAKAMERAAGFSLPKVQRIQLGLNGRSPKEALANALHQCLVNVARSSDSKSARDFAVPAFNNTQELAQAIVDLSRAIASDYYVEGCHRPWYDQTAMEYVVNDVFHLLLKHADTDYVCDNPRPFWHMLVEVGQNSFLNRAFNHQLEPEQLAQLVKEAQALDGLAMDKTGSRIFLFFPSSAQQVEVAKDLGLKNPQQHELVGKMLRRRHEFGGDMILSDQDLQLLLEQSQSDLAALETRKEQIKSEMIRPLLEELGLQNFEVDFPGTEMPNFDPELKTLVTVTVDEGKMSIVIQNDLGDDQVGLDPRALLKAVLG